MELKNGTWANCNTTNTTEAQWPQRDPQIPKVNSNGRMEAHVKCELGAEPEGLNLNGRRCKPTEHFNGRK